MSLHRCHETLAMVLRWSRHYFVYEDDSCCFPNTYSLCPKTIVLPSQKICPEMIIRFIRPARNSRLKVKYFQAKLSLSRSLSTPQFQGGFRSRSRFIYFESHTYNYSANGQQALTSPKLRTQTIIFRRREYQMGNSRNQPFINGWSIPTWIN